MSPTEARASCAWSSDARRTAQRLASEWGLELGDELLGATCSLVIEAGADCVLKLPFPHAEEASSWRTVEAFSGHGGIELLRRDSESGAMLMPRLRPGTNLSDSGLSDLEAVDVCADLILALRAAPVVEAISLGDWYKQLPVGSARHSDTPALQHSNTSLFLEARRVYADLQLDLPPPVLLHGDLHHLNILRDCSRWVIIDPKGLVGDPSFEIVGFMRNPVSHPPDPAGMRSRLERFAERLGDPIERLWGWSFVETVNCSSSPGGFDWSAAAEAIWDARP